jgi:hypothetical protein
MHRIRGRKSAQLAVSILAHVLFVGILMRGLERPPQTDQHPVMEVQLAPPFALDRQMTEGRVGNQPIVPIPPSKRRHREHSPDAVASEPRSSSPPAARSGPAATSRDSSRNPEAVPVIAGVEAARDSLRAILGCSDHPGFQPSERERENCRRRLAQATPSAFNADRARAWSGFAVVAAAQELARKEAAGPIINPIELCKGPYQNLGLGCLPHHNVEY